MVNDPCLIFMQESLFFYGTDLIV